MSDDVGKVSGKPKYAAVISSRRGSQSSCDEREPSSLLLIESRSTQVIPTCIASGTI